MGRVLKILSLAVIMFLAYMGITLMTKSCNRGKDEKTAQLVNENKDNKIDEFADEEFFADEDTTATEKTIDYKELDQTIADTKTEIQEKQELPSTTATNPKSMTTTTTGKIAQPKTEISTKPKAEVKPKPVASKPAEVKTTPDQSPESLNGTGAFTVVAGNYLLEANADQMVKKLKAKGFNNSEKVVFDFSEFFTVIAGKFSNYDSAAKTVSNLKAKGVDCYIHRNK